METPLCNDIDCLIIIPYFTLVKLYHYCERALGCSFIGILQHLKDEALHLFVDAVVPMFQIQSLQITYQSIVKEFSQFLIFTLEQLE